VLDLTETARVAGFCPRPWREALAEYVAEYLAGRAAPSQG